MVSVRNEEQHWLFETFPRTPRVHSQTPLSTKRDAEHAFSICPRPPRKQRIASVADERSVPLLPLPLDSDEEEERIVSSFERVSLEPRHDSRARFPFASPCAVAARNTLLLRSCPDVGTCPKLPLHADQDLSRVPLLSMKHRIRGLL